MAKSKSGGTRTFIRGRVGSDVYSVGRDAKGKKQQVVRSLAESVANPQTKTQMRGRMIMSTIAQALAELRVICDHSFDNVIGARANLAEFTSRNYSLIKADVAAHPSTGNKFGLNSYQEKGAKQGCYIIADGMAQLPSALVLTKASGIIAITMPADNITIGGLKAALGMSAEEYFTLVGLTQAGKAEYERFRINPTLADETAISAANIADVFAVEGNVAAVISVDSNVIDITLASIANDCAVIISKKVNGKFIHNEAVLGDGSNFSAPSDTALPTYPVGSQAYLNGGDIFGQSESFNPGEEPGPTPSPTESSIASATVNGASLTQNGTQQLTDQSNAIVVNINAGSDGASYGVAIVDASAAVLGQSVASGEQTAVAGSSVNLSIVGNAAQSSKKIVLCRANVISQVWGTLTQPAAPEPSSDAELTALSLSGNNLLSSEATYTNMGGNAVFAYTGSNLAGSVLALSASQALNVGDTLDVSQLASNKKHEFVNNSGDTGNLYLNITYERLYLVADNKVAQVCGRVKQMDQE